LSFVPVISLSANTTKGDGSSKLVKGSNGVLEIPSMAMSKWEAGRDFAGKTMMDREFGRARFVGHIAVLGATSSSDLFTACRC
jgi:hypothetical protein